MHYERPNMPSHSYAKLLSLPCSLLSLLVLFPMTVIAQSTTTDRPLTSEATLSTTTTSFPQSSQSMVTSFTSPTTPNTTAFSTTSTSAPISNDILPGRSNPNDDPNAGIFHYYWLILAAFGIFLTVFLWWINRHRRRRKEQMRLSGQNALARDMEGWVNTRRRFHGAWRSNQARALVRREEGLNEHGEAPPPYEPNDDATVTQGLAQDHASGLSIPLRTYSRDQVDAGRPPEYREAVSRRGASTIRLETVTSHTETSGSPPRSSIRNPLPDQTVRQEDTQD